LLKALPKAGTVPYFWHLTLQQAAENTLAIHLKREFYNIIKMNSLK
jgi:hypothetical protein